MKFIVFYSLLALVAANTPIFFYSGPHCTGGGSGRLELNPAGEGHCFKTGGYRSFRTGHCPGRISYAGYAHDSDGVCVGERTRTFFTKSGKCITLPKFHGGTIVTCHIKHNLEAEAESES